MSNINTIQLEIGGKSYEIEAKHFIYGPEDSPLIDTPTQWKAYIDQQVATAAKIQLVVDTWNTGKTGPATTASADTMGKIYLCANEGTLAGTYTEFVTIKSGTAEPYTYSWEKIGTTATDLSAYAKKGTYTTTDKSLTTASSTTGISITSSGGHETSAATFSGTYRRSATSTGQNTSVSDEATTGENGSFSVTPTFTGTQGTVSASISGASLNSIKYTPTGSIGGSASVPAHSHSVNVSTATQSMLTSASVAANGSHSHSVAAHTHSGTGTASVINSFTGGSITSSGTATVVTSATATISSNYGFSASQSVLSSAAVSGTVLVISSTTANKTSTITPSSSTTTVNKGYTHTAATLSYKTSDAFAIGNTAATLTTASAGSHAHTVNTTAATITYVTGATTGSAGGATINGTSFSFNGEEATLEPTFATQGSFSTTFTPKGTISAVSIGTHNHSYQKPVAHTHSITLSDATVNVSGKVQVSNHTHTIQDNGHSHSIAAHNHNVTLTNSD